MWVSQILTSWSMRTGGERLNFYERLLRGMPARLSKCRANKYGPCAKWPCAKNCAVQAFACRCKVTLPPCSVCGLAAMLWLTGTSWLMLQAGCGELTVLAEICANAQFESAELGCGIHYLNILWYNSNSFCLKFRCSIVVSILACHAGDPGSIPGGGEAAGACSFSSACLQTITDSFLLAVRFGRGLFGMMHHPMGTTRHAPFGNNPSLQCYNSLRRAGSLHPPLPSH